mgnify:FL=1
MSLCLILISCNSANNEIVVDKQRILTWMKFYGGEKNDKAYSISQTTDGGYIVVGETNSYYSSFVKADIIILKIGPNGELEGVRETYGGHEYDRAYSIQQTKDGGYIVAGEADVSENFTTGKMWILKLNSKRKIEWEKKYSSGEYDRAYSIQQTKDGRYIVAGQVGPLNFPSKMHILKLDSNGEKEWEKFYIGNDSDSANGAYSIQQTKDGGYIVAGRASSNSNVETNMIVLKLDLDGEVEWQFIYEGEENEFNKAYSIQQTTDGGYIVAGEEGHCGESSDAIVLKINKNGKIEWQKAVYSVDNEWSRANSIQQTKDGGYIVAGETDNICDNRIFILKLDSNAEKKWEKVYDKIAGCADKIKCSANSIQQTKDGGYIVAGWVKLTEDNSQDILILKLDENGEIPRNNYNCLCNSSNE